MYEHIPDQSLFEPDPERENREPTVWDTIRHSGKLLVGVLAILGLLYLSGVYQGFLFRETPPEVTHPSVESVLDADTLALPVRIVVLRSDGSLGSDRTTESIESLVREGNRIWNQADIDLRVVSVEDVHLTDSDILGFFASPRYFISKFVNPAEDIVNVFLVQHLQSINGIAFVDMKTTFVADFTTVNDFRTFAHEIGHILGLGHVSGDRGRLMFQGANGTRLSPEEVLIARQEAEKFK